MKIKIKNLILLRVIFFAASSIISVVLFPTIAFGSVIFSDDFEWGEDWNSSQGSTAPVANGWNNGILMANRGGDFEAAYVNAVGAKQGLRGFIQYWDQESGYGDAQNIFLNTSGLVFPDEYYLGYWMRVDPNWDWGEVQSLKIVKTNLGLGTWDIAWVTQGQMIQYCGGDGLDGGVDDWCYVGTLHWTGDADPIASISTDEAGYSVFGNWSEIDGGAWHYFVWHFDHANNILELSVDGSSAYQMSSDPFPINGIFASGVTLERWNFGGNITNGGGGYDEMYTAYDDLIIATSEVEVSDFLGVTESGDTTAPTSPQGLSVL